MGRKEENTAPIEPLVDAPQTETVPTPLTRRQEIDIIYPPVNKAHTINGRGGHTGSPRNSWT